MTRPQQESLAGYDAVLARFDRAFETTQTWRANAATQAWPS